MNTEKELTPRQLEDLEFRKQHSERMASDMLLVEEYKEHKIYQSKTDETSFIVIHPSPDYSVFIVGLDDSKSSGSRKSVPVTVANCREYINFSTRGQEKKEKKRDSGIVCLSKMSEELKPVSKESGSMIYAAGQPTSPS